MEEEVKKRGRPKKERRGGRREGAGRKKGFRLKENPRNDSVSFAVSEKTLNQIRSLRELTKDDELNFNSMFILWVEEVAKDYGLDTESGAA